MNRESYYDRFSAVAAAPVEQRRLLIGHCSARAFCHWTTLSALALTFLIMNLAASAVPFVVALVLIVPPALLTARLHNRKFHSYLVTARPLSSLQVWVLRILEVCGVVAVIMLATLIFM